MQTQKTVTITKNNPKKQKRLPKQDRPKRTKPVIRQNVGGEVVIKVPECSLHYTAALADPFETPAGACIPSELFPLPSAKSRWTQKGKFNLGTTGTGFILYTPVTVNSVNTLQYTGSTSVGTSATAMSAFTNIASTSLVAIPYTGSQMSAPATLQARVVAAGIRVSYIGVLQNTNGEAFSYEEPDHQDISGLTPAFIEQRQQCSRRKVAQALNDYCGEVYYSGPVQPSDVEFLPSTAPTGTNTMGIILEGNAGDLYDYEIVVHLEHIGNSSAARTMSHSEPAMTGKTIEAAKTVAENRPLDSSTSKKVGSTFIDSVRAMLPTIVQGGRVLSKVVSGDMAGAAMGIIDMAQNPVANRALRAPNDPYAPSHYGGGGPVQEKMTLSKPTGNSLWSMFGLG